VTTTRLQFHADLETLGMRRQRQYESRATFRNLCLRAGASEFHVNLITHPKVKTAADLYTRVEQQWEGMCDAIRCIDERAWGEAVGTASPGRGVTVEVYVCGTGQEKAPPALTAGGAQMVTPTGLEPMLSA
jgi:hypothetical protein